MRAVMTSACTVSMVVLASGWRVDVKNKWCGLARVGLCRVFDLVERSTVVARVDCSVGAGRQYSG